MQPAAGRGLLCRTRAGLEAQHGGSIALGWGVGAVSAAQKVERLRPTALTKLAGSGFYCLLDEAGE